MDTNLFLKEAKAKFNHNAAKDYLKDKYQSKLIFADQGGLWKATPELLSFLTGITQDKFVVVDLYDNPIKIDRAKLLIKATEIYNETMNAWYAEYEELRKKR